MNNVSRSRALLAALLAAPLLLTGCAGTSGASADGATDYEFTRLEAGDNGLFAAAERQPSPAITGDSLDGVPIDTSAMVGQVVVLNFWADWCAPCRAEAPVLNEVYARTQAQGVEFVGVNVKDDRNAARAFERTQGVQYDSIFDQPAVQLTKFRKVVPQTPPSTLLIDRQGRVAGIFNGAVTIGTLQPAVEALAA